MTLRTEVEELWCAPNIFFDDLLDLNRQVTSSV